VSSDCQLVDIVDDNCSGGRKRHKDR
jgi:hypothetical protein